MPISFDREAPRFDADELEEMLGRALARSAVMSARRRRRRSAIGSVGLVVAALVAIVGVGRPQRTHMGGESPVPHWKLVADVSAGWQVLPGLGPGGGLPPSEMTCPSTSTCYALGMAPSDPPPSGYSPQKSPASPPIVVKIEATTDSGKSWLPVNLPVSVSDASLSCVSASTCALLGLDSTDGPVFLETSDGAQTWSSQTAPSELTSGSFPTALDCVSTVECMAVVTTLDDAGTPAGFSLTTSDGGQTWIKGTLPANLVPNGLTCTDGGDCVVTGCAGDCVLTGSGSPVLGGAGAAAYSADRGVTWTAATLPPDTNALQSDACESSGFCITSSSGGPSAAGTVLTSSNDGVTWAEVSATGTASTQTGDLLTTSASIPGSGFSCPATTDCWTFGTVPPPNASGAFNLATAHGFLAQSTDAGHAWQPAQLPGTVKAVLSVACPTNTNCYAQAIVGTGSGPATIDLLSDNL
ncbi:MAG: WD40/YVTN/BNR-like repeat-containing protein [Solirubrobacteraceae bacterium]